MIGRIRNYLNLPGNGPRLVKALVGSAGLRLVGMGFGFLVGVQLARGLGPAGYGVYGTAMAIVALLMIPTELGLPQLVMREVAAAHSLNGAGAMSGIVRWARRAVISTSLTIAVIAFGVFASGLIQVSSAVRNALLIGLLWIPVVAIGNIYGAALRGAHQVVSGQLGEILLRPAVVSLLLAAVALVGTNLLTPAHAMGINVLGALAGAVFSIVWLRSTNAKLLREAAYVPESLSFSQSLPIAMTEGMRVLAAQVGVLVLAAMATNSDVGLYRVASGVYIATTMPSALVNVACAPTIARLFARGDISNIARLNYAVSVFLMMAAAGFIILHLIFGQITVSVLFGIEYAGAADLLLILLVGELVASLFGHPAVVLNMMRRQRAVMWWSAVALALNSSIAVFLVKTIGYAGAAVGTAAGMIVWRAGCAVYAKRRLGIDTSWVTRAIPRGIAV